MDIVRNGERDATNYFLAIGTRRAFSS